MILNQAYLFLIFVANGILIGLVFDIFRILRKSFKTLDIITYLEDILFWIITGLILLYSIFIFSNGEIRLYMFLGVFLGCLFYMLLFSKYFIKINVKIILIFKNIISKIYNLLIFPIKIIFNFIRRILFKPIHFITINIKKINFSSRKKVKDVINSKNKKIRV